MKQKIFGVTVAKLTASFGQTIYMVGLSLFFGAILGILLALVLVLCRKGGLKENRIVYGIVSTFVNIVRSVPFVILIVTIMPLTRAIMGTTIGSTAALVPLIFYISPYMARLVENSLLEVSDGIIEAARAMAGYVGGGGIGDLALTYGYQKFNTPLMIFTVVILIIVVQLLQALGNGLSRRLREHN